MLKNVILFSEMMLIGGCQVMPSSSCTARGSIVTIEDGPIPNCNSSALSGDIGAAHILCSSDSPYWVEIAAENGDPVAAHNMGALLYSNDDPQKLIRSLYWYRRAAGLGFTLDKGDIVRLEGRLNKLLGANFIERITKKDHSKAEFLVFLALSGEPESALMVCKSPSVEATTSAYWYRIAAQNGSNEAAYHYGNLLIGSKSRVDVLRGYFWVRRAASKNHPEAVSMLKRLKDFDVAPPDGSF